MKTVEINMGERSYQIRIAPGLLGQAREIIPWIEDEQVFIVTNKIVAPLYLEKLKNSLAEKNVEEIILSDGEDTKSLQTAELIFDQMMAMSQSRTATVVALGGGVIGDMAGFVAACYQRGVPFIQIPTTLLSQVDSSVGGKTAVNHPRGKNMIGAFYQPQRVIADISTLATLNSRQFASGLAEVIKYGMINDPSFFEWLESNIELVMSQDENAIQTVVEQSCLNKARIVEQDERESGVRALLNLGHTFGHAIETATGYKTWLHGEATALGLVMATFMSCKQGWIEERDLGRVKALLSRAALPVEPSSELNAVKLKSLMGHDKKVKAGKVRLVLMKSIGEAFVSDDFDETILDDTLNHFAKKS